jgi:hypothetical protein
MGNRAGGYDPGGWSEYEPPDEQWGEDPVAGVDPEAEADQARRA